MRDLFAILTLLPLPLWVGMLLFPRAAFTRRLVTSPWPFIVLGSLYALLLLAALVSLGPAGLGFSAEAMQGAIKDGWGFLALWAHVLILDLFLGVWIFRDARYWAMNAAPYLLLALFAGPAGLAVYLHYRRRREGSDPIRNLN